MGNVLIQLSYAKRVWSSLHIPPGRGGFFSSKPEQQVVVEVKDRKFGGLFIFPSHQSGAISFISSDVSGILAHPVPPRVRKIRVTPMTVLKPQNLVKIFRGLFVWLGLVLLFNCNRKQERGQNTKQRVFAVSDDSTINSLLKRVVPGIH